MEEEHEIKKPKKSFKTNKRHWQISTVVLAILFIISIITTGFNFGVSADTIKSTLEEISSATVTSLEKESGVYKANIQDENGNEGFVYISEDGELLFQGAVEVEVIRSYMNSMETPTGATTQEEPTEYPKKEKPEVDLFVMSYCPYGLQAQQLMLPVMELLKDKADIKIRFVSYIMHDKQEIDENTNQYCIQKEQPDKFIDYLKCFVGSKDSESCIETASVDKDKLDDCIKAADEEFEITKNYEDKSTWLNDKFPAYNVDKEDNEKYGIRGSPSLLINGQSYGGSRSSEDYKQAICSSFTEPPEECKEALSTTATQTDGQC